MRGLQILGAIVCIYMLTMVIAGSVFDDKPPRPPEPQFDPPPAVDPVEPVPDPLEDRIEWRSLDEAISISRATAKPMLCYFWFEACVPCQKVKAIWEDPEIAEMLAREFVAVSVELPNGTSDERLAVLENQRWALDVAGVEAVPAVAICVIHDGAPSGFVGATIGAKKLLPGGEVIQSGRFLEYVEMGLKQITERLGK